LVSQRGPELFEQLHDRFALFAADAVAMQMLCTDIVGVVGVAEIALPCLRVASRGRSPHKRQCGPQVSFQELGASAHEFIEHWRPVCHGSRLGCPPGKWAAPEMLRSTPTTAELRLRGSRVDACTSLSAGAAKTSCNE